MYAEQPSLEDSFLALGASVLMAFFILLVLLAGAYYNFPTFRSAVVTLVARLKAEFWLLASSSKWAEAFQRRVWS
jgi:hypothetical protein